MDETFATPLNLFQTGASELRTPVVNGYLGELAAKSQLPDDLLSWIMGTCRVVL